MRQNDRADLEDMAADIGLTDLTKQSILSYPLPDQQTCEEKYSAFAYLHSDAQNPICGTAHNIASPEMLYVSGSGGVQFDERRRQMSHSDEILDGIICAVSAKEMEGNQNKAVSTE